MNVTRALRRGHSLSQHTQFLKNIMIAENIFYETLIQSIGPKFQHFQPACILLALLMRTKNFEKKSVSQSTRNALKRIEMKKKIYLFDRLCVLRVKKSPSSVLQ